MRNIKLLLFVLVCFLLVGCVKKIIKKDYLKEITNPDYVEAVKEEVKEVVPEVPKPLAVTLKLETINFDFDKAILTAQARQILKNNASKMREIDGGILHIEGHCDARGSLEYNMGLGERRAVAVMEYYQALGINHIVIVTISFGEERPICKKKMRECYRKNRRAVSILQ